jgi:formylglycine-generating enzyme required for sulfatase activity
MPETDRQTEQEKRELLESLHFIYLEGGVVRLGTEHPILCRLEGYRKNETPVREAEVAPFWICRFKVTNALYEQINPKHKRPPQSPDDDTPVVDVMYGEVLTFCRKVNEQTGMNFRLPTEREWTFAAAPYGWEFAYKEGHEPDITQAHTFGDGQEPRAVMVNDPRWQPNWCGLDQMGHNVSEMTGEAYYASGHDGAETDGMYCIVKGGNFGHCSLSPGIARRCLFDVSDRNPRLGFRLAHDKI